MNSPHPIFSSFDALSPPLVSDDVIIFKRMIMSTYKSLKICRTLSSPAYWQAQADNKWGRYEFYIKDAPESSFKTTQLALADFNLHLV